MTDDDEDSATASLRVQQLVMELDELSETVERLEQRIDDLESQLESLSGLGENEQSTPGKRALDLRRMLITAAEAKRDNAGDNPGLVQWEWSDVQSHLEANGHGTVHAHQCYRAMEDAANGIDGDGDDHPDHGPDGFAVTENSDGNRVVRCSLPAITDIDAVIQNNNGQADGHREQPPKTEVNTSDP